MKNIFIFTLLFIAAGCASVAQKESNISNRPIVEAIQSTPAPLPDPEPDWHIAVRLAEEFVKRNGYTDAPADKSNLTKESIEFEADVDKMLAERKGTLEAKAYGYSEFGKMGTVGWTVVFRHTEDALKEFSGADKKMYEKMGRAVTMDEKFENLCLEHKEFPLANAKNKLIND